MSKLNYMNLPQRVVGARAARVFEHLQPKSGELNVLSLKDVQFIDPFGLILTAEYLRYLKFAAQQVALYLPQDARLLNYLRRSRFLEFAAQLGEVMPESKVISASLKEEEWLLPLTPLRSEEEVPDLVARLYKNLLGLIERSGTMSPSQAAHLSSLLAELCQNVTQHSFDLGLVAAQVYRGASTESGRSLQLAVGDLGIGLRGSLSRRYAAQNWDDAEVIRQALAQGVSSVSETGRGLGLSLVYQKTSELGGRMLLRSGAALLESRGGKDDFSGGGYFPGTQIALEYRSG